MPYAPYVLASRDHTVQLHLLLAHAVTIASAQAQLDTLHTCLIAFRLGSERNMQKKAARSGGNHGNQHGVVKCAVIVFVPIEILYA